MVVTLRQNENRNESKNTSITRETIGRRESVVISVASGPRIPLSKLQDQPHFSDDTKWNSHCASEHDFYTYDLGLRRHARNIVYV